MGSNLRGSQTGEIKALRTSCLGVLDEIDIADEHLRKGGGVAGYVAKSMVVKGALVRDFILIEKTKTVMKPRFK